MRCESVPAPVQMRGSFDTTYGELGRVPGFAGPPEHGKAYLLARRQRRSQQQRRETSAPGTPVRQQRLLEPLDRSPKGGDPEIAEPSGGPKRPPSRPSSHSG